MHTRANAVSTTSQWYYKWSDKMRSSLPLLRAFWRIAIYAADVTYTIQWHSCIVHRKKKHNVCIYLLMCLPPVGRKTDVHCNTATEYAARCVRVYTGEGHAFQNAWLRYGVKKKKSRLGYILTKIRKFMLLSINNRIKKYLKRQLKRKKLNCIEEYELMVKFKFALNLD